MTRRRVGALVLAGALLASALSACGDGAGAVLTPVPTTPVPPTATVDTSLPPFLQTPAVDRRLPAGIYALGWTGEGEPVEVRSEILLDGYEVQTVTQGLDAPVAMAFLPDGSALVTEQHTGRIRVVQNGSLREEPFAVIDNVVQDALEIGLLGIAVDPEFGDNHWVYAFYVEAAPDNSAARSVIVRFTERDGVGVERTEIAELPAPRRTIHAGGGLAFGPDGKLYVTIGDTARDWLAADPAEPVGKILRLNRDGTAPHDNPFAGRANADPRVFATGFRNIFGVAFHPRLPGKLIALNNAVVEGDEIEIVTPGGHYGWNDGEGEPSIWQYLNAVGPAGPIVYTSDRLPRFTGDLFFCQFHLGGPLHRVRFSDDFSRVVSDSVVALNCTSTVTEGPDGFIYFLDRMDGVLYRIGGP